MQINYIKKLHIWTQFLILVVNDTLYEDKRIIETLNEDKRIIETLYEDKRICCNLDLICFYFSM